jgi:hypothetical protein
MGKSSNEAAPTQRLEAREGRGACEGKSEMRDKPKNSAASLEGKAPFSVWVVYTSMPLVLPAGDPRPIDDKTRFRMMRFLLQTRPFTRLSTAEAEDLLESLGRGSDEAIVSGADAIETPLGEATALICHMDPLDGVLDPVGEGEQTAAGSAWATASAAKVRGRAIVAGISPPDALCRFFGFLEEERTALPDFVAQCVAEHERAKLADATRAQSPRAATPRKGL